MPSDIDATKPEQGNATTLSVRENFAAAKAEILDLQGEDTAINTRVDTRAERAGDIGGTTSSSTVVAIQNRAVSGATPAPTAGQPLTWQATPAPGHWEPMNVIQIQGTAVSATAPTNGQQLRYDTTAPAGWKATTNTVTLTGDVTASGDASPAGGIASTVERIRGRNILATAPTASQALVYNGTDWTPGPVTQLQGRPVNATAPSAGQGLVFSGTEWTPTSGAAAAQALAFRAMTPDLNDWIPSGTEGMFAGEGTAITNAPDAGKWRYIANASAAAGSISLLAVSDNDNGRLMQRTCIGGTWSAWVSYVTQASTTNNVFGENLSPNGASDHANYTISTSSPTTDPTAWNTIWETTTANSVLAYPFTAPLTAGSAYRITWVNQPTGPGYPMGTLYLRTGPTTTAGQQTIVSPMGQNGPGPVNYINWTGIASGAFTHLVFVFTSSSISAGIGINSPTVREFVTDGANLVTNATNVAVGSRWALVGGSGGTGVYNRAAAAQPDGTDDDRLIYTLASPIEPGRFYWIRWNMTQVSTSDYSGMAPSLTLRTSPTETNQQIIFNANGQLMFDRSEIREYGAAYTHIVINPNQYTNGAFRMISVTPVLGSGRVLEGLNNLFLGQNALLSATSAARNVTIGDDTLRDNLVGNNNTVVGFSALRTGTGTGNTAIGQRAMVAATTGQNNVAIGNQAAEVMTSASSNVLIGNTVARALTSGGSNVILGNNAAAAQTTAASNIILGNSAGSAVTTGGTSVFIGASSGRGNNTGTAIVAVGNQCLYGGTAYAATGNTCVGATSLYALTSGTYNTAIGHSAMYPTTTASNCVAVGYQAGRYRTGTTAETTMENSVYLGHLTRSGGAGRTNQIVIGVDVNGRGSNTAQLGSDATTNAYWGNGTHAEWSVTSDVRMKEEIQPADLDRCLATVAALPVSRFKWKDEMHARDRHVTGFLADDVEQVFPKAVSKTDREGYQDLKSTNLTELLPTTVGAIQKLLKRVEQLEAELKELRHHGS